MRRRGSNTVFFILAAMLLAVGLAVPLGPVNLLFVAALFLELAVLCARRLERTCLRMRNGARPGR